MIQRLFGIKIIKRMFCCIPVFLLCFFTGMGQDSDKQKIVQELKSISENYRATRYLSFDISYKYANESEPMVHLDTLSGSFRMTGDQYWYSLDNTEAVGNKQYVVMLFKEDKIMYVTKPSAFTVSQNPIALIDSILNNNDSIHCSISSNKNQKKIKLEFQPGMKYKSIEYEIDPSGFISKMLCIVQASELYDASVKELVESEDTYAVIEAGFTNYKKTSFNSDQFNVTKYFKKEGEEFIVLPPYEDYKIFLGTTNL